jgi:chromosome partitioning protein
MRTIAIMNQKGGVGKTTTTANLSHALALAGKSVLALDLDPQGQLGATLGVRAGQQRGMDAVLMEGSPLAEVCVEVRPNLFLVPAGQRLGELEQLNKGGSTRGMLLNKAMQEVEGPDFVFIDCPPASGLLVMNALFAADELLIPVASDYLALHGVSRLMGLIQCVEDAVGKWREKWVVLTRFQKRRSLANEVCTKLREYFPAHVLATPIREAVALAESPGFGMSIFEYNKDSNGAEDYRSLAQDVLKGRTMH